MPAAVPYVIAAVAAAGTAYNTQRTARKQDRAAADSIRNQSRKQRQIDEKINQDVDELAKSDAASERADALASYATQLRTNRAAAGNGLRGPGGSAFQQDAAVAESAVSDYGMQNASLLSRIDAPTLQRRGENNSFSLLGQDINLVAREAQGQQFIDNLRLRAIQRNPWIDAAAAAGNAYAGSAGGSVPMQQPGPYASGYVYQPRTW